MGLTKDYQDSFKALDLLLDIKQTLENLKDVNALQEARDAYQKLKNKADEVDQKISQSVSLAAQNKKLLEDLETANTILDEKKSSNDAASAELGRRKTALDSKDKEQQNLADVLTKRADELNSAAADLEKKISVYNQNLAGLESDKKRLADEKEEMRLRAEKIKTATEGL